MFLYSADLQPTFHLDIYLFLPHLLCPKYQETDSLSRFTLCRVTEHRAWDKLYSHPLHTDQL